MHPVSLLGGSYGRIERALVAARDMQLGAERRHHVDAIAGLELGGEVMQVLARDDPSAETRLCYHLTRGAFGQQLAESDVSDLMTAFGLVHVVGRDQHGDAVGGEVVDLVPELAPRLGLDAGGRLIEQKQLGLRQDAGAERKPLLPSAGQIAGELLGARGKPEPSDCFTRRLARVRHAIDACHEFEVLANRQVGV